MMTFPLRFEDCAGYRFAEWRTGLFSGQAEIRIVEDIGGYPTWIINSISLQCDNGKMGEAAKGCLIELNQIHDGALWSALAESIKEDYGATLDERVVEECALEVA